MPISLEELKKQREQMQQHLDWLDAQIAQLSETSDAPKAAVPLQTPGVTVAVKPEAETVAEAAPQNDASNTNNAEAEQIDASEDAPEAQLIDLDPEAPTYKAKTQGELRKAQIGCLIFFILGIALFLFLLFGLPYLL